MKPVSCENWEKVHRHGFLFFIEFTHSTFSWLYTGISSVHLQKIVT